VLDRARDAGREMGVPSGAGPFLACTLPFDVHRLRR
jgi:hypothetical protein